MLKEMICVGTYSDEQLEAVRLAGFDTVELSFSKLAAMTDEQISEHLDFLKSLNLKPVAANVFFGSGINSFFGGYFDICQFREYISMAFEKTKMIKWESIAFGSGYMRKVPDGYPMEKAYEFMAQLLQEEVVPYLERYDAYLNIEELNTVETNFINTCRDAVKLVNMVDHPRVGILCDFYHMSLAGETHEDVPEFAKYINHVHIASPSNNRLLPCENDGDNEKYRAFFAALKKNGYKSGIVSVEALLPENIDFPTAMKGTYDYLQKEFDIVNGICEN